MEIGLINGSRIRGMVKVFYNSTFGEWLEESEHGFSVVKDSAKGAKIRR